MSDEPRYCMHQTNEFVDVTERDPDGGDVAVVRYSRAIGSAFARQQARATVELLNLRESETFKQGSDKLARLLAAALRWHNARRRAEVQSSAEADAHLADAEFELASALSALREDET